MIKSLKLWLHNSQVNNKALLHYSIYTISELLIYFFLPLSFSKTIFYISLQNFQLAKLWSITYFLLQIFSILIHKLKNEFLFALISKTTTLLSAKHYTARTIQEISRHAYTIDSFLVSSIKLFTTALLCFIYNKLLGFQIIFAIIFCTTVSYIIQKYKLNKNSQLSNYGTANIINCLWIINMFVITIYSINITNHQLISLNTFLLIITFINTHLFKPPFSGSIIIKTNKIKTLLTHSRNPNNA